MKNQFIRVNTKKGLLAGFECAKDFPGTTEITLVRKSGETKYYLRPFSIDDYIPFFAYNKLISYPENTKDKFNQFIQKAKGKIKQTKACYLLE